MRATTTLPRRWLSPTATLAVAAATLWVASLAAWTTFAKDKKTAPGAQADKTASITGEKNTERVHITVQTVPPRKAFVKWGRKSLGVIPAPRPLVIERPRDSGPMDLVIRANGYLPVRTRAYTFTDSRVAVRLTPPEEKNKLFGYREEPAPNPDAGPPPTPSAPAPAAAPLSPAPAATPLPAAPPVGPMPQ